MKLKTTATVFAVCSLLGGCIAEDESPDELTGTQNERLNDGEVAFRSNLLTENGVPIQGALVSVWADDKRYSDETDSEGYYSIVAPTRNFPRSGSIVLTMVRDGFQPGRIFYTAPISDRTVYRASGGTPTLESCPNCIEITNSSRAADLWHLGDDRYGGALNSQFQKSTDSNRGLFFEFVQPPTANTLTVEFVAKGIEDRCQSVINYVSQGSLVSQKILNDSPRDGKYGIQRFTFPGQTGPSSIGIVTGSCSSTDVDDFEFAGLKISWN